MQCIEFEIKGSSLIVRDLDNEGTLHITFKPFNKPMISPVYEAWNDLELAINKGELNLKLFGINTIREQRGFLLKGDVTLSSSHLYDPTVFNSQLHLVSLKPKSTIMNSKLTFVGSGRFGEVTFNECQLNTTPVNGIPKGRPVYFQNCLV